MRWKRRLSSLWMDHLENMIFIPGQLFRSEWRIDALLKFARIASRPLSLDFVFFGFEFDFEVNRMSHIWQRIRE